MALVWEYIENQNEEAKGFSLLRAKVTGGWLLVTGYYTGSGGYCDYYRYSGPGFYPDPEHDWDGNSLP